MTLAADEPISVSLLYDSKTGKCMPRSIVWRNRLYRVNKLGLHHTYREGDALIHAFSVLCGSALFKLIFDTRSLNWRLVEMSDNLMS